MNKREQLVKELQALIDKPEMNDIIKKKLEDAWREGENESGTRWVERCNKIFARQKHHMSEEEKKHMDKTHFFYSGDENDPECNYCGISDHEMFDWPQYCLTKEEKES